MDMGVVTGFGVVSDGGASDADRWKVTWPGVAIFERPIVMETQVGGIMYVKLVAGGSYQPEKDRLQVPPTRDSVDAAQIMYAAEMAMAGVREYCFDTGEDQGNRAAAAIGSTDWNIGTNPYMSNTDIRQNIATANNVVRRYEPFLLQQRMHATALGSGNFRGHIWLGSPFSVCARTFAGGKLYMATSWSEVPRTATVDLSPYQNKNTIARLRQCGATVHVDNIASAGAGTVNFAPGESIWYLFMTTPSTIPPAVAFTAPMPNGNVSGTVSLQATAAAKNGEKISTVQLHVDGKLVGTATGAPYTCSWDSTTVGKAIWHGISAVATDDAGNASEARMMLFVVPTSGADEEPPTACTIAAPPNNSVYTLPATITFTTSASDPDGNISCVEYWNGCKLIGSSTTSPFAFNWVNPPPGGWTCRLVLGPRREPGGQSAFDPRAPRAQSPPRIKSAPEP
jgi:hypothetical protein